MADLFHFDLGGVLTFGLGVIISAGAYYVRSTVSLSAHASIASAEKRLEDLATRLIERIDGVKDAVQALNVTLGRADERIAQAQRDIQKLETRTSSLETQLVHARNQGC